MQCEKCGTKNSINSINCIKCNNELIKLDQEEEYCENCGNPLLYSDRPCPYCNHTLEKPEEIFCADCHTTLKKGLLFSNIKRPDSLERLLLNINESKVFCDNCIEKHKNKASNKLKTMQIKFEGYLNEMPVLSVEKPSNLTIIQYCGIVSSQSLVRIENLNENANDAEIWNDPESEFGQKIGLAERSCKLSLKKRALLYGANAVINCDINYTELGCASHMFLVGMMGTSVIVEEFDLLTEYEQNIYNHIVEKNYKI